MFTKFREMAKLSTLVLCVNLFVVVHARNLDANKCDAVVPFFDIKNISTSEIYSQTDKSKTLCNGDCCGANAEEQLRSLVKQDFSSLLRHNSRSLQGLLTTTANTLHDHMHQLSLKSENKTLHLFTQVYRRMSVLARKPINTLYSEIRRYIVVPNGDFTTQTTPNTIDIKDAVNNFFTDLFPLAYHQVISAHAHDFSFEYKSCLRNAFSELRPFGDIPRQVAMSTSKSLEATRVLLLAFQVGTEILNATDLLLTQDRDTHSHKCHEALMKMSYCPKCLGYLNTKPCSGYCLNVLRGCLTQYVSELDSPWNDYVEAIERLVIAIKKHDNAIGVNADSVIRNLDTKISEAIMYAMENGPMLEKKVRHACGSVQISDKEDPLISESSEFSNESPSSHVGHKQRSGGAASQVIRMSPPDMQLLSFLTSVVKSRGFYANLADNLCQDDNFAETKDGAECWNGQRIGEYTKTVVDASLSMQKYNPEVQSDTKEVQPSVQLQVVKLADKLRHVRQMVVATIGTAGVPQVDNYMQGDAAEGSGSGGRPGYNYGREDDEHPYAGSGSGDGDGEEDEEVEPPATCRGPSCKVGGDTRNVPNGHRTVKPVRPATTESTTHVHGKTSNRNLENSRNSNEISNNNNDNSSSLTVEAHAKMLCLLTVVILVSQRIV